MFERRGVLEERSEPRDLKHKEMVHALGESRVKDERVIYAAQPDVVRDYECEAA